MQRCNNNRFFSFFPKKQFFFCAFSLLNWWSSLTLQKKIYLPPPLFSRLLLINVILHLVKYCSIIRPDSGRPASPNNPIKVLKRVFSVVLVILGLFCRIYYMHIYFLLAITMCCVLAECWKEKLDNWLLMALICFAGEFIFFPTTSPALPRHHFTVCTIHTLYSNFAAKREHTAHILRNHMAKRVCAMRAAFLRKKREFQF